MNDITRRFPPRTQPRVEPEPVHPVHDDVTRFLNTHSELRDRCAMFADELERRKADVEQLQRRADFLDGELRRAQIARDEYQRGYYELQAQLSVMASAAISGCKQVESVVAGTCKQVADAAIASLEAAKAAMIRAGVEPPRLFSDGGGDADFSGDGVKRIAEKFGADARSPDHESSGG